MKCRGVMLQMDGSYHPWIYGEIACCLIVMIDDADNDILWAEFVDQETTIDCMRGIKSVVDTYGSFSILYTDKAGVFGGKRMGFGQVQRALNEIDSTIIFAHSPEAKGRVERLFQTLQDRLVSEMKLFGVSTRIAANAYLKNIFLPKIWREKFRLKGEVESSFKKLEIDTNEVFCLKENRKISRDNLIRLKKSIFQLPENLGNCRGGNVEIRTYLDGNRKVFYNGFEIINLKEMRADRKAS